MDRTGRSERQYQDATARTKPGRASDYIQSFDAIQRGTKVVIVSRVSWEDQSSHLPKQRRQLREAVNAVGGNIIKTMPGVVHSGKDPSWLVPALRLARRYRAVILARDTSRFIRHPIFDFAKYPNALPRDCDFERLRDWTGDLQLVTLLKPDATVDEINAFHSKGNPGGRPAKRTYGERWDDLDAATQQKIIRMLAAEASLQYVANAIGRKRVTIQKWRERLRREGKLAAV